VGRADQPVLGSEAMRPGGGLPFTECSPLVNLLADDSRVHGPARESRSSPAYQDLSKELKFLREARLPRKLRLTIMMFPVTTCRDRKRAVQSVRGILYRRFNRSYPTSTCRELAGSFTRLRDESHS